ncbi:MAG: penicillin-binding transpeptidase domain-containing protein [Tissierellia bacterium]|nr:penicillin-binding transpeptidase domain-containing protein [Tissierellia bacterium]
MFWLQVVAANGLTKRALENLSHTEKLPVSRGIIKDRRGKKLVMNISKSAVLLDTAEFSRSEELEAQKKVLYKSAGDYLGLEQGEIDEKIAKGGTQVLATQVERTKALAMKSQGIRGLRLEEMDSRSYPFDSSAAHVLGFTSRDGDGIYGVEKSYDEELTGALGSRLVYTGGQGGSIQSTQGADIHLTLDREIQRVAEEAIATGKEKNKARRVSVLAQDVHTGAILAMATTDLFDPNDPQRPLLPEQQQVWESLSQKEKTERLYQNWRNFTVSDLYEPGSTFKTITAAAALEEHTTDPKKHYYCTGYIRDLQGITITCSSLPNPHGDITMDMGFAKSCNPTFVYMARELGKENFLKYIRGFGFGEPTGIDLPSEGRGIIPKSAEDISDVNLATMSYGHGIAVTPIQMINAISSVVNGGNLMVPYVVSDITTPGGEVIYSRKPQIKRQVISSDTSRTMRELMGMVVTDGTGTLAHIPGYRVGGKSGTADKVSEKGGYEEGKYISSFVSVAPLEDPKIAVLVIVEEPQGDIYGGHVAAPITSTILEAALGAEGIGATEEKTPQRDRRILVPDVENMLLEDAGRVLTEAGLQFTASSTQSKTGIITQQTPGPGVEVPQNTLVELKVDPNNEGATRTPNLMGKTREELSDLLEEAGIPFDITGEGVVIQQSPRGGEPFEDDAVLKLQLGDPEAIQEDGDDNGKANSGNAAGENNQ